MSIKGLKLNTVMLLHIFLIPSDLGAAEFSQVRPSNDQVHRRCDHVSLRTTA